MARGEEKCTIELFIFWVYAVFAMFAMFDV